MGKQQRTIALTWCLLLGLACGWSVWAVGKGTDDLAKPASWTQPTLAVAREQVARWLEEAKVVGGTRDAVLALWKDDSAGPADLLDRMVASIELADPRVAEVTKWVQAENQAAPPSFSILSDEQIPAFERLHLRLAYGRWLSQRSHFDESLEQLGGLKPEQVLDPTGLLFYQAVAYHRLLKKEECLAALDKLLENRSSLPRRFATVAELMAVDMRPLETDSLDEISRLMSDVRRRLNFGHAGKKVRTVEDEVIAKLDKKIDEIEKKLQQMQMQGAEGKQANRPDQPAKESGNYGGKGPGDVDQKKIGSKSGWGNLPPKEREQALQQISKDLPAHYREAIEEYFRKLARESDK